MAGDTTLLCNNTQNSASTLIQVGERDVYKKIKKSGLATALSNRAKPILKIVAPASEVFPEWGNYLLLLSLVRHNLLCHSETSYAELILDMGYALETEVFGA